MIKVSELKKLGIDVIVGDQTENGPVTLSNINIVNNHLSFGDAVITKFAPRTNNGVRPAVHDSILLDVLLVDHAIMTSHVRDIVWGFTPKGDDDDRDVVNWKPNVESVVKRALEAECKCVKNDINKYVKDDMNSDYINGVPFYQKGFGVPAPPVFTHKMANNDELPPIGSMYMTNGGEYTCIVHGDNGDNGVSVGKTDKGFVWTHGLDECKPVRTEREKAIDHMALFIPLHNSEDKQIIAEALYDEGYRK